MSAQRKEITKVAFPGLKRAIIDLGVFSFIINMMMLVMPLYLLQVYDRVLPSNRTETLIYLSIIACGALVFLGVFEGLRTFYASRVANRFALANQKSVYFASVYSPMAGSGDIQAVRDLNAIKNFIGSKLAFLVFDLPFAPLFIAVLYFIHPVLFFMTVAGAVLLVFLAILNQIVISKQTKQANADAITGMSRAAAYVANADALRAMGMVGSTYNRWSDDQMEGLAAGDTAARTSAFFAGLSRTTRMVLQIGVLGVGGYLVLLGEMTAGMIFACSIISGRGLQPIDQLIGSWRQFVESRQTYGRFKRYVASAKSDRKSDPVPRLRGAIQVENIFYHLPQVPTSEPSVISNISFRLEAGESLAIIGGNGAGKSTLARLLVGSLNANRGFVRIDGADVRSYDQDELGQQIGYLGQRVELLPGTLAENISRFAANPSLEEIEKSARKALVHDDIAKLPDGYQTRVGAGLYEPSGGQLQRLGLARALYGDPAIIVLDEPNANLDIGGNQQFLSILRELNQAKVTTIVVTQRLDLLEFMDKILVLVNGQRADFGPSVDLIRKHNLPVPAEFMARLQRAASGTQAGNAPNGTARPTASAANGSRQIAQPPATASARKSNGAKTGHADSESKQTNGDKAIDKGRQSPFSGFGPGMKPINPETPDPDGGAK